MLRLAILSIVLAAGDTPEKTFDEIQKAAAAKNWEGLYDLLAPSERREFEGEWDRRKKEGEPRELQMVAELLGLKEEEVRKLSARDVMLRMMPRMLEKNPEAFDREFAKYRDGTLADRRVEGDLCILTIKTGDKQEEAELAREEGKWYITNPARRKSNERNASASLKSCVTAQADFRANDRDADGANNFWVKDVAGLHGLQVDGEALKLIELSVAHADRTAGKGAYPSVKEEKPKAGYHFVSLKSCRERGKAVPYDEGKGKNSARFGMAAYPAQYPQNGRLTFLISEANVMFSKDTRGKPPEEFPEDPAKDGWKRVD